MSFRGSMVNSESEHGDSMDSDVLPTVYPHTPTYIPNTDHLPFQYYAFTGYGIPVGTPLATPRNPFQHIAGSHRDNPRIFPEIPTASTDIPSTTSRRKYRKDQDKLEAIFKLLQDFNWTIGDFLYLAFRVKDEKGAVVKNRSEAHAKMASRFLAGLCKHTPAHIVEIWVKSPWGIPKKGRLERNAMFSTDRDFRMLKAARPGLTSFAVQIVREQLEKDIQKAVKRSSGLHTFTTGARKIADENYGAQTFMEATAVLQQHQPLAWDLFVQLATPPTSKKGNTGVTRQSRPPEMVCSIPIINSYYQSLA